MKRKLFFLIAGVVLLLGALRVPAPLIHPVVSTTTYVGDFTGNGSGLTNLNLEYGRFPTNGASTVAIVLSKVQGLATNNNLSFVGLSGIEPSGTNYQGALLCITNTS